MDNRTNRIKLLIWLTIFIVILFTFSILILSGCTDTLDGEIRSNQKPIVSFVNIPPDGQRFSRNPEVYWVGADNDGQIDYYRYYIIAVADAGGDPLSFIQTLDDTSWIYVDIDPLVSDPQTANIISLKADLTDPVNTYIPQYIFLQAFDDAGDGSDIKYRTFNRNDNPPETKIHSVVGDIPFVNSQFEGGIITGVKLSWEGHDEKDYEDAGLIPPPFDYEWRLYGPYTDAEIALIDSLYILDIFVTEDAKIYNLGDTLILCVDTGFIDTNIGGNDTVIFLDSCDTVIFTDSTPNTPFFRGENILLVDSSLFTNNIVRTSWNGIDVWIQDTTDILFNVFSSFPSDTTIQMNFVFWLRSRDDAFVADLTPAFKIFPVVNPRYERDIAVLDFSPLNNPFNSYKDDDTAKVFWYNIINNWNPTINFDTSFFDPVLDPGIDSRLYNKTGQDYIIPSRYGFDGIPVELLLKHKLLILYNEGVWASGMFKDAKVNNTEIFIAIEAGINVWATWRAPIVGDPNYNNFNVPIPPLLTKYFGVSSMVYSQWWRYAGGHNQPRMRIEDFIGAYSIDSTQWPNLDIDTSLLHSRLRWISVPWDDTLGALPEVNWSGRAFGTEVMYLYKSLHGSTHPLSFVYSFEGSPVGHRLKTNMYRTVHFNFTMLTLDSNQAQQLSSSVLDWLYDPTLSASKNISENRYPDAPVWISVEQARRAYEEMMEESYQENLDF